MILITGADSWRRRDLIGSEDRMGYGTPLSPHAGQQSNTDQQMSFRTR